MSYSYFSRYIIISSLLITTFWSPITPSAQESPSSWHTLAVQAFNGAIAAGAEGITGKPLSYFKNTLQQQKPISAHPSVWYRGFGLNMASMGPTTMVQVVATHILKNTIPLQGTFNILASAFCAGILSAGIVVPTETVIIHQENQGKSMMRTIKTLIATHGVRSLFRGIMPTAGREGIFNLMYQGVAPWFKMQIMPYVNNHEFIASIAGGIGAGGLSAVFTHPLDTIKTKIQAAPARHLSSSAVFNEIRIHQGLSGFFRGFSARGLRVTSAVTIMSLVLEELKKLQNPS